MRDRLVATVMGNRAVELILEGKSNLVVCMQHSKIVDVDIEYALNLDKKYKNNMSKEELAALSDDDKKSMNKFIKEKKAEMESLYKIVKRVSI